MTSSSSSSFTRVALASSSSSSTRIRGSAAGGGSALVVGGESLPLSPCHSQLPSLSEKGREEEGEEVLFSDIVEEIQEKRRRLDGK